MGAAVQSPLSVKLLLLKDKGLCLLFRNQNVMLLLLGVVNVVILVALEGGEASPLLVHIPNALVR